MNRGGRLTIDGEKGSSGKSFSPVGFWIGNPRWGAVEVLILTICKAIVEGEFPKILDDD